MQQAVKHKSASQAKRLMGALYISILLACDLNAPDWVGGFWLLKINKGRKRAFASSGYFLKNNTNCIKPSPFMFPLFYTFLMESA